MTRTPDEIKRGMECCGTGKYGNHKDCPYDITEPQCMQRMLADALALIRQLEAQNTEKDARIKQLEAERDALHEGLKVELGCYACKNYVDDPDYDSNECMDCGKNRCNFEWRGVQKEE